MIRQLLAFLLLIACAQTHGQEIKSTIGWRKLNNGGFYENVVNPCTSLPQTAVFSEPDTASSVLGTVERGHDLHIIKWGEQVFTITTEVDGPNGRPRKRNQYKYMYWYEVDWGMEKGYILKQNVSLHSFTNGDFKYIFSAGQPVLYKYDRKKKMLVDSLTGLARADVVQQLDLPDWPNVNRAFRLTMINAFCGGGRTDMYIVDTNDSLSIVLTAGYFNDSPDLEEYVSSCVFVPLSIQQHILFAEDGNTSLLPIEGVANEDQQVPIPDQLSSMKGQLLVRRITTESQKKDDRNQPVLDGNGQSIWIRKHTYEYYHWKGKTLVELSPK